MSGLHVDIVTPEKIVFSGSADEIRVPGVNGEFGVLPQSNESVAFSVGPCCMGRFKGVDSIRLVFYRVLQPLHLGAELVAIGDKRAVLRV